MTTHVETRTNTDYGAIANASAQIISTSSKAVKEEKIARMQMQEIKEKREAKEMATYSSREITNQWTENHFGFLEMTQGTYRQEKVFAVKDEKAVEEIKKNVETTMKDKEFSEDNTACVLRGLDNIANGSFESDFLDLGWKELSAEGTFSLRAGGIHINLFQAEEKQPRPFKRFDRVIVKRNGKERKAIVKLIREKESKYDVEFEDEEKWQWQRADPPSLVSVSAENVFCAETGESFKYKVVTKHFAAVSVSIGHLKGKLNSPIRYTREKITKTQGNDTTVTELERRENLQTILGPDDLLDLGRMALELPKGSVQKPVMISPPDEVKEKK